MQRRKYLPTNEILPALPCAVGFRRYHQRAGIHGLRALHRAPREFDYRSATPLSPNIIRALFAPTPLSIRLWCSKNDGLCVQNTENALIPSSLISYLVFGRPLRLSGKFFIRPRKRDIIAPKLRIRLPPTFDKTRGLNARSQNQCAA